MHHCASKLQDLFPGMLAATPQSVGLVVLQQARQTTNNQLSAGRFPFPTVYIGRKRMVLLEDVQLVLDAAKLKGNQKYLKRRIGRPRKAETLVGAPGGEVQHG
jgi:hypothetical protein